MARVKTAFNNPTFIEMEDFASAIWCGRDDEVAEFLERYGLTDDVLYRNNHSVANCFKTAADKGHKKTVELLVQAGILQKDPVSNEALHSAASSGHEQILEFLLNNGARINFEDHFGFTPLTIAADRRKIGCVRILLKHKANIEGNIRPKDNKPRHTPLGCAAYNGYFDIVKLLLDHGAKTESRSGILKTTPLIDAAEKNHADIVRLLLDKGAKAGATDHYWHTALERACFTHAKKTVKLLLERKAPAANPILSYVADLGDADLIELALGRKEDIEQKDDKGLTPLMRGARASVAAVKTLLKNGASLEAKDNEGRTALIIAREEEQDRIKVFSAANDHTQQQTDIVRYFESVLKERARIKHQRFLDETDFKKGLKKPLPIPKRPKFGH